MQSQFSFCKESWHTPAVSSTEYFESKTHEIKSCYLQLADAGLIDLQPVPKVGTTVHPFVFKSTSAYVQRLPKRKYMVLFGISLIWYHAQLKRLTNAYFFMKRM